MSVMETRADAAPSSPRPESSTARGRTRALAARIGPENLALIVAEFLLVAGIATQTDKFFLPQNLLNIGQNIAVVGVAAVGETIVVVSAGLDISIGSIAGVASVVSALLVTNAGSVWGGVAGALAVGILLGLLNAAVITKLRVSPVVATLATLSAFQGLAFLIAPGGRPIGVLDSTFRQFGSGRIFQAGSFPGIPISLLILLAVAGIAHVTMRYTVYGRNIYAMGGNPNAARLSGINLTRMKFAVYALSGATAALAGVILTARTSSGQPVSGSQGLELDALTAVFLGGALMQGGKGTIGGTMLAVVLLGTLSNGMNLLGIATFYQLVAKGLLLIIAVGIGQWRVARAEKAQAAVAAG